MNHPQSLWLTTANPAPQLPALDRDIQTDVAIVGAGYTGLVAAHHLARAGVACAILEANDAGWGASGRNGGLVSGKFRVPFHVVDKAHGRDEARRLHRVGKQAIETVADLVREHDITSADFRMAGYVTAAHSAHALQAQRSATEWLADALGDTSSHMLDRAEVAAETGS
ncbi:MAG: NAD(P)/FAD-dependent oxidoreductase, partial [Burkholderiaceae bacterium]